MIAFRTCYSCLICSQKLPDMHEDHLVEAGPMATAVLRAWQAKFQEILLCTTHVDSEAQRNAKSSFALKIPGQHAVSRFTRGFICSKQAWCFVIRQRDMFDSMEFPFCQGLMKSSYACTSAWAAEILAFCRPHF